MRPGKSFGLKLWLGAGLLFAFIGTLVVGNFFISREKSVERAMLGHDFTAFYAAGFFADTEQFDKLYDIEAVKRHEQETGKRYGLTLGDSYGPYWNPPFYAWVFAPLSRLPYPQALAIWTVINLTCFIAAIALLCWMLPPASGWRTWALVPTLLVLSMPVLQAFSHGQNTCTSLLLLTAAVTFWRKGRGVWAGLISGLLFYKPQLGAIVALAMLIDLGLPAVVGLMATGLALTFVTALSMPGALGAFIHELPANVRLMQVEHAYLWERHATIKAFWRLLFQGRGAGEAKFIVTALTLLCTGALGIALLRAAWKSERRDAVIAATITTMPLLMPFYFDYDLMLLAVPAVLYARRRIFGETDVWLDRAWVALFLWTLVNPGIAGWTRINLTVPLLTCLAGRSISIALQPAKSKTVGVQFPLRLAA